MGWTGQRRSGKTVSTRITCREDLRCPVSLPSVLLWRQRTTIQVTRPDAAHQGSPIGGARPPDAAHRCAARTIDRFSRFVYKTFQEKSTHSPKAAVDDDLIPRWSITAPG